MLDVHFLRLLLPPRQFHDYRALFRKAPGNHGTTAQRLFRRLRRRPSRHFSHQADSFDVACDGSKAFKDPKQLSTSSLSVSAMNIPATTLKSNTTMNPPVARNQEKNDAMSAAAAVALTGLQSVSTGDSTSTGGNSNSNKTGKKTRKTGKKDEAVAIEVSKTFPQILMEILSDPANEECIAWLPHGCSFRVHNRSRFLNEVLPPHYKNKKIKYTSFTRKLSRWDFVRLSSGPDTGAFYHKLFQRDNPQLVRRMFCKGERTQLQFPRNLSALAGLPAHMQAAVAAGMPSIPGTFGGMAWNAALGGASASASAGTMPQSQSQVMDQAQGQQQQQQQPMANPMLLQMHMQQMQQQQQQQNFATGGTMMGNTSTHSGDGSTTANGSTSDQQDSSSTTTNEQQQQQPLAPSANPAGMAIGPADMTAFLASMNNPNISPAVKAKMLAQQQTLLQQQQLILQQQLAASGINVAVTPNPPITVPTANVPPTALQQEEDAEQAQAQAVAEPESMPDQEQQQEAERPSQEQQEPMMQEVLAQPQQQQHQQQSVSRGEIQHEIQRQMELLRAQQATALQGQQHQSQQQEMSAHDFLAAQAAAKLDTSNLHFTPMPTPGQPAPVGAGQDSSATPGSRRSPSAESGGAVKRAWAA